MTDLVEIHNRWAKSTPGPWRWIDPDTDLAIGDFEEEWKIALHADAEVIIWVAETDGCSNVTGNMDLICHAPEDIKFLLAEIERLEAGREIERKIIWELMDRLKEKNV